MARTPEGALLTERHRRRQLTISASVLRDLLHIWSTVDPQLLRDTLGPFVQAAGTVVRAGRRASALVASRYYVDFRRFEGVAGLTVVTAAVPPEPGVVESNLRGAGLKGVLTARAAGREPVEAARNGFVKLAGSASSLVLGGGRDTLLGAIHADPAARGWQRVTDGAPCAFCRMVASKGATFKSGGSASFQAHGHCGCSAEPYFDGSKSLPANERFKAEYDEATAGLSGDEALNAYRRSLSQSTTTD